MNAAAIIAASSGSTRSYNDSDMSIPPTLALSKQKDGDTHTHTQTQPAALRPQAHKKVGDHLLIEEEGCFFPCVVLEVVDAAQGVWLVHYLGWDHIRDEQVGGASSAARILPDTPAHRLLCEDLECQIRRIQRKGSQLPRVSDSASAAAGCRCRSRGCIGWTTWQGDATRVMKNKVVDATIVETAIRQPE